jgi:hypothetical protein
VRGSLPISNLRPRYSIENPQCARLPEIGLKAKGNGRGGSLEEAEASMPT